MRIIAAGAGLKPKRRLSIYRLVEALAVPFPPSKTDLRILMSDWSHFQGDNDIGKHIAYGPPKFRGVVIRTGQGHSASYDDVKIHQNVQMCEANDFPWMVYHVLLPNQDVPRQVGRLATILNSLNGVMPKWIWWDVELKNEQSKRTISNKTIQAVEMTKPEIGIDAGVYSAKWFTDGFMETQDWFSEIIWWIAQWLWPDQQKEHPWPTALPATVDISQVMIHQTTSWGDGKLCGIGSTRFDLDRWMWTIAKFNEIMGVGNGNGEPSEDLKEQVQHNTRQLEEQQERLNIIDEYLRSYDGH